MQIVGGKFQGCVQLYSVSSKEVKDKVGVWPLFSSEGSEVWPSPISHNKHFLVFILSQVKKKRKRANGMESSHFKWIILAMDLKCGEGRLELGRQIKRPFQTPISFHGLGTDNN